MTEERVLAALRVTGGLPSTSSKKSSPPCREIYESGTGPKLKPSGHFFMTFAAFPGGTSEEIPRAIIDRLEQRGLIKRSYPDKPHLNAWRIA